MLPIATVDTESRSGWPFLFVGAGDATYVEWAEVHVLFEEPPDEAAQREIARSIPAPLRDSVDWNDIHLMVASDQFAHDAIAETYGSEDEVERFNGAIEAWLHEAHRRAPILVAYRHEDEESGGTELSPWHFWSVHQTDRLLPVLEPILDRGLDDATTHAARGILEMVRDAGVFLPKRVQSLLDPGEPIRAALDSGDGDTLRELADRPNAIELLEEELSARQPKHLRALLGAAEALVTREELPNELAIALGRAAVQAPNDPQARRALDYVRGRSLEIKAVADMLAYHGYQAIQTNQWLESIALFDLVLDSPLLERTAYNNALYAVMADNNKLPIDRPRAERFLTASLKFGPENPSIFYNAACVYHELGDADRTIECLALARKHGYEDPKKMRDEPMFATIASDPRFAKIFEDL